MALAPARLISLARPTWTLLAIGNDFRWLREREDTPWYPTMRLFRQPAVNDWDSVFRRVAEELANEIKRAGASATK